MKNIDLIVQAIMARKPIEFEYVRVGKVAGIREGNPHILFSGTTQQGMDRTYLHIVQTAGASDTLIVYPDWRMFIADYIHNVRIRFDEPEFDIHPEYNPLAEMYAKSIAQC